MFHHALPRLLALALSLAGLATAALATDSCTTPATAHVDGTSSFGMGGMAMTFEQTADLVRVSEGPGLDGNWVVTDWSIVTTMPAAAPVGSAMFAVPEWEATCSATQITPQQYKHHCSGEIPLVVENGAIAWTAGGAAIGAIAGAAGAAGMTLNILPNQGGFDWTMAGKVAGGGSAKLDVEATGARMRYVQGILVGRQYDITVTVKPPKPNWINALDVVTNRNGKIPVPSATAAGKTTTGRKFQILVQGYSTKARAAIVDTTSIDAFINLKNCQTSASWPLDKVLFAYGITP